MKNTMKALYIVLVGTCVPLISESKYALRLYNGIDADTTKYPYVVAFKSEVDPTQYEQRLCTGSFVTENWVLSSAECLSNIVKYVQYGNLSLPLESTEDKTHVLKMVRHPRFFAASYVNNIGLSLVKTVSMSKYGRLSAVDYVTMMGHPVEYVGFGMTFMPKQKVMNKKKVLKHDLIRPLQIGEGAVKSCSEPFSRNFICLSSKCSHRQLIMFGDAGAPLMCGGKIIGVACIFLLEQYEHVFTPISPHLNWIHDVITTQTP